MNRSKQIADGALLTAIFALLLFITVFIPVVSIVTTFLLPVPFILYARKHSYQPSLLMLVAAMGVTALIATLVSVPITLSAGIGGIVIGTCMYKQRHAYTTLLRGILGYVTGFVLMFVISQFVFDINLVDGIDDVINQSIQTSKDLFDQIGLGSEADKQFAIVEKQMHNLTNLIPVGIVILSTLMAFISQWVSYRFINRMGNKKYYFPPFRTLKLPVSLVWIFFFAIIMSYFDLDPAGSVYLAVENVLVLTGLLMTLQGFSFIFFYAHHKKMSRAIPIVIVVIALVFSFFFLYLVRILGIIDIGFHLREHLMKKDD